MNGYTMMADSYRDLMNEGRIDKEVAEKNVRIYEFLATCDIDDLCIMVDSSAFNDIIRSFLKLALTNAELDKDSQEKALSQLRWLFDEKTAWEVLNG